MAGGAASSVNDSNEILLSPLEIERDVGSARRRTAERSFGGQKHAMAHCAAGCLGCLNFTRSVCQWLSFPCGPCSIWSVAKNCQPQIVYESARSRSTCPGPGVPRHAGVASAAGDAEAVVNLGV